MTSELGYRLIKRTPRTENLPQAYLRAIQLTASHPQLFATMREQRVSKLGRQESTIRVAVLRIRLIATR
jgi:hypothetical protein